MNRDSNANIPLSAEFRHRSISSSKRPHPHRPFGHWRNVPRKNPIDLNLSCTYEKFEMTTGARAHSVSLPIVHSKMEKNVRPQRLFSKRMNQLHQKTIPIEFLRFSFDINYFIYLNNIYILVHYFCNLIIARNGEKATRASANVVSFA